MIKYICQLIFTSDPYFSEKDTIILWSDRSTPTSRRSNETHLSAIDPIVNLVFPLFTQQESMFHSTIFDDVNKSVYGTE